MAVAGNLATQTFKHPTRVAVRPEEDRTVIAVDPNDLESLSCEKDRHLGTNQATGTRDECAFCHHIYLMLSGAAQRLQRSYQGRCLANRYQPETPRSEEHTSELQS